jgi:glutamate---cysteine ligase / carboxylate-amine ligase
MAERRRPTPLTVGVEEEFLLLDPDSWHNAPESAAVLAGLPRELRRYGRVEFRRSMVEMVTPVCTDLPGLQAHLARHRSAAAAAATRAGTRLVAVGATPVAEPDRRVNDTPRFRAIAGHYGPIAYDPAVCGCHVHVGVPSRAVAVEVCTRLRPWLPVIQALGVNSPLYGGSDTGHASWRAIQLERWPSLGPTPHFESTAEFDAAVASLVASGAMLDQSMVLWYARPSDTYPTVEIRAADIAPTAEEAGLIAGLVRALVATALDDIAAARPAPRVPDLLLRAAHWNAAHTGLAGTLLDARDGQARPAWDLVDELCAAVKPALCGLGDEERVHAALDQVRRDGTGAERQRRLYERTGDVGAVLAALAAGPVDAIA